MPDGDILRATLEGTYAGEPVVVGFGFVSGAGAPDFATDAQGLFDALYSAWSLASTPTPPLLAPLSEHYTLDQIRIQDLNPGVSAGLTFPLGLVGGNTTDDALPPSAALCVTWRTGLKGKENRGRSYLTGFAEDSQNAGYWIPEIQGYATYNFANPLMDQFGPISASGYRLSLVHTMAGGSRIIPPTATPIISFTVNNTVRNLRRRSVGVRISRRRSSP